MGRRLSLTRKQRLMGWMVSIFCAGRCCYPSHLVYRYTADATPANACLARSDDCFVPCSCSQLLVFSRCPCDVDPATLTIPTSALSGRSSQPLNQGSSSCTATPTPPLSSTARSPTPSQVNHAVSSPSTSSSPTTQAPAEPHLSAPPQSHPSSLASSVSPSAPFSRLYLRSPDA